MRSRLLLSAAILSCVIGTSLLSAQQAELQKVVASDPTPNAEFGRSVAIDGDRALIGAPYVAEAGRLYQGAVYFFEQVGGVWVEQQRLVAGDAAAEDRFGFSVALQGDRAVIGAAYKGEGAIGQTGAVYVFELIAGTWIEQVKLVPVDSTGGMRFGERVSLDGDTLLVGAPGSARAYVFEHDSGAWTQQARFDGAGYSAFAAALALSGDAVAIGAQTSGPGIVFVYQRSGSTWSLHSSLTSSVPQASGHFGSSLAIAGDRLIVGAGGESVGGQVTGAAYVYENLGGSWALQQRLEPSDPRFGLSFGGSVATHGDVVVVGAIHANPNNASGGGYVFRLAGGSWSEEVRLFASDAGGNPDQLGFTVAYNGQQALLGAPWGNASYFYEVASGGGGPLAPRGLALGDANGDGDLDAVTANSASHDLGVWLGDGTGALAAPVSVALASGDLAPVAVAFGDLDGDGAADDVAVACSDSHTVGVVLNVGAAAIASSRTSGGLRPNDVACGDLDGNGTDDVVVGRGGEPLAGGAGIAVALNGGAFVELVIPGGNARQVVKLALGDLDGDGDLDLAAVAQGAPDQLLLFAGDGAGGLTFAGAISLATSGLANGLCLDDLDGDGTNDLVVLLSTLFPTPSSSLQVHRYTGSGPLDASDFTADAALATTGTLALDVACGELDGDSVPGVQHRPELVVVHAGSGDVQALYGYVSATNSATSTVPLATGSNPIAVAIGDLNGDGAGDVVIANQGSDDLSVHLGELVAQTLAFGNGCAGTGGLVPLLEGSGVPTLGNATFGLQLSQARAVAPYLALLSATQDELPLGPCTLYLGVPLVSILRFTDVSGENDYVFGVPNDPQLLGATIFFQGAVFDPAGAFASTLALSNGLRVRVGG